MGASLKLIWRKVNKKRWQANALKHIKLDQERRQLEVAASQVSMRAMNVLERLTPKVSLKVDLVMIGDGGDGTYVVPHDDKIGGVGCLVSPGVGFSSSFEYYFASQGLRCVLIDGSVSSPALTHENFVFIRKFLGTGQGDLTLDEVLSQHSKGKEFILQMDIEGAEYDVLGRDCISDENLKKARWMVLELHEIHRLFVQSFQDGMLATLERVLEHFTPVYLNCNNTAFPINIGQLELPPVIEVTLVNREFDTEERKSIGESSKPREIPKILNADWLPSLSWPIRGS